MTLKALVRAFKKPDHILFLAVPPLIILNVYLGVAVWLSVLFFDMVEHLREEEKP